MLHKSAILATVTGLVSVTTAQLGGWAQGQVSATMCTWEQLRAAVVRDTVFLDGGYLAWLQQFGSGQSEIMPEDSNPHGVVFTLNFSVPFETSANISAILGMLPKAPDGSLASNIAPNYFDGAMLANDDEWFLYGGLLVQTAAESEPSGTEVLEYQAYQYGVFKPAFEPNFVNKDLGGSMTDYIAYGGAANAPSENKAWYFSGLRSPEWGPIYYPFGNDSLTAINVSNTLITLDMTVQQQEKFGNQTLPPDIPGRANPEFIWVPTGPNGIVVAVGGVVYPDFVTDIFKSENATASQQISPTFMSTIDIYDVGANQWYRQSASGDVPPALTRGCAVVAPAQDASSFNIYWYGGYDGLNSEGQFNDDVYVLSVPSFTWTKVYNGTAAHARAGHKCVMPYPDQMFVIGGYPTQASEGCLDNTEIIQIFNLSSAQWLNSYDPSTWSKYLVPDSVVSAIGGKPAGGATATTPLPSGWEATGLKAAFATPYPTSKITTYYPYTLAPSPSNSTLPTLPAKSSHGSGVPSFLAPLLGVVLGLVLVTAIAVAIILYRKRKYLKRGGSSEAATDENGNRILSWMRGQPSENKAPTLSATEEVPSSPGVDDIYMGTVPVAHHEMPDSQIAELWDTSPQPELQDTGLTPMEVINKYTRVGQKGGGTSSNDPSGYSTVSPTDHASTVSRSSAAVFATRVSPDLGSHSAAEQSGPDDGGVSGSDDRTAAEAATTAAPRVTSDVSAATTEADRAQLRHLSDVTVSTITSPMRHDFTGAAAVGAPQLHDIADTVVSPAVDDEPFVGASTPLLSPPTGDIKEGEDYLTARPAGTAGAAGGSGAAQRKSAFVENQGDMGDQA